MKKNINNKRYDTSTARFVANWEDDNYGDLEHYGETLYCKKTGEYFLYGRGGAKTRYARRTGTYTWSAGEDIIPFTYDDARAWAEKHMDADAYDVEFGAPTEDTTQTNLTLSLPACFVEQLRQAAKKEGIGISELVMRKFGA